MNILGIIVSALLYFTTPIVCFYVRRPLSTMEQIMHEEIVKNDVIFDYNYRLPDDLLPQTYLLQFTLNPDSKSIPAKSLIRFLCQKPTHQLAFHENRDFIKVEKICEKSAETCLNLDWCRHDKSKMVTFCQLEYSLTAGRLYDFKFDFKIIKINSLHADPVNVKGLQRATAIDGSPFFYTISQMLGARRIFPCLDEPKFKAKFQLTIDLEGDWPSTFTTVALTNTDLRQRFGNRWIFEPTPLMSTYLLTFAAGTFSRVCSYRFGAGVCQNVNPLQMTSKYLELRTLETDALEFLRFMQNYLNWTISERLEIVYIDSFQYAIEPWGLITIGSTYLKKPLKSRSTMHHEIAHYWFGNLLTPRDWKDLWLSEGLAEFFSMLVDHRAGTVGDWRGARNHFNKKLQRWDRVGRLPPVVSPVWANDYDKRQRIVMTCYHKGALLIQMISDIIGENRFRNFLQNLVHKYPYSTVNTDSFVQELRAQSRNIQDALGRRFDSTQFLLSWLHQESFPTVTVDYDFSSSVVRIRQNCSNGETWWLPMWSYDIISRETKVWFLTGRELRIDFDQFSNMSSNLPLRLRWNARQFGYYKLRIQASYSCEQNRRSGKIICS